MSSSLNFKFAAYFLTSLSVFAQNGLTDIPDTAVEAQLNAFKLIDGAKINLFAKETDVMNPTHMNWDAEGRLWVVSSPLYPHIKPGQEEQDKIVILEDTDGDGVSDKSIEFANGLHIPTGILPGDGGCYVANAVEVLFLKDNDGDGKADERRVVLSGFGTEDTHHLVHTFRWGPEGMLWMNQSIYIHTHLDTPYGTRRLLGGGMWHYRPETKRSEVFMKGLVNPWGHVFDEWGQSFLTDGAGGEGINFVYPRSVFLSSPGAPRIVEGLNPGQPKHCGLEVLDGGHVPDQLQKTLATADFRGNRVNLFKLTDKDSAYTSTQIEDLVSSTHGAFRPIDVKMGPDGAIYIADWYNPIIQHGEVDFRDPRRDQAHGRIWRINFEGKDLVKKPKIADASEAELLAALQAPESYTRNAATAELRTRNADAVLEAIQQATLAEGSDPELFELRKVWAGQTVNRFDSAAALKLTEAKNPKIRAAALRALYYDAAQIPGALAAAEKAVSDSNPHVRLWGVSVLAQLTSPDTVKIALRALEGITPDDYLDFAVWSICREHESNWTKENLETNPFETPAQLLFAVRALNKPLAVSLILSYLEEGKLKKDEEITGISDWISKVGSASDLDRLFDFSLGGSVLPAHKTSILAALDSATKLRKIQPSGDMNRLNQFLSSDDSDTFEKAASLAGLWKLESAREPLNAAFLQADKNLDRAKSALQGIVSLGGTQSEAFLKDIATHDTSSFTLKSLAVMGLTKINVNQGAALAVSILQKAPDGLDTYGIYDAFLNSKKGSIALTKALENATLPQAIATVGLNKAQSSPTRPEALVAAIQKAGQLKPMKTVLTPEELEAMMKLVAEKGDAHRGEAIYRRPALMCSACHAIGGIGAKIGPDMVSIGASAPVDYLIESMLQPSVKIKEGYHTTLITLKNGSTVAGAIASEDNNELVIRDATGNENRIAKSDIVTNQISPISLMPQGLTASLREDEFIDLIRFLSELGKDGDFKTTSQRFVRSWQNLLPHASTFVSHEYYGAKVFAEKVDGYVWLPIYSKVGGALSIKELPEVVGRKGVKLGVVRSFIDIKQAGTMKLKLRGNLAELDLVLGNEEIVLPSEGNEALLEIELKNLGKQALTIAGLKNTELEDFSVEILDDASKVELLNLSDF